MTNCDETERLRVLLRAESSLSLLRDAIDENFITWDAGSPEDEDERDVLRVEAVFESTRVAGRVLIYKSLSSGREYERVGTDSRGFHWLARRDLINGKITSGGLFRVRDGDLHRQFRLVQQCACDLEVGDRPCPVHGMEPY